MVENNGPAMSRVKVGIQSGRRDSGMSYEITSPGIIRSHVVLIVSLVSCNKLSFALHQADHSANLAQVWSALVMLSLMILQGLVWFFTGPAAKVIAFFT